MGSCDIFLLLFLLVFYLIFLLICFVQLQLICQFVQIVFDIGIFFLTIKKSKFRKYSWQLNFSLNDSNAFIIKVFWRFQFFFLFLRFSWFCIYITLFFSGGGVMDAFGEHDCKFFLCFTFLWFKKPQQNMYRTGSVNSNLNRGYSDIHTLYNRWTILIDSHTPA